MEGVGAELLNGRSGGRVGVPSVVPKGRRAR